MNNKQVEQQHIEMQEELNKLLSKNGLIEDKHKIIAIGYLDISEPFEKGEVSQRFLLKLKSLWNEGMTLGSMGHHTCEFCQKATSSSEKILIDRENKIKYIFPEMIFHYCQVHKYLPPPDFIKFVMEA